MTKKSGLFGVQNPILGRGEAISEKAQRGRGGGHDNSIRTFEEAQQRLLPQLTEVIEKFSYKPHRLKLNKNVFFSVNIDSKFLAKSYFPGGVLQNHDMRIAGTRYWNQTLRDGEELSEPARGRCVFVKAELSSIENFVIALDKGNFNKTEQVQLTRIDSIFSEPENKISLPYDFVTGAVELVFHPMTDEEWEECRNKIKELGLVDQFGLINELGIQFYNDDIRFVPTTAPRDILEILQEFNPLRFARIVPKINVPILTEHDKREIIETLGKSRSSSGQLNFKVGVFDGGIDNRAGLDKWVVSEDLTAMPSDSQWLEHGTAVCSAVVFGQINPDVPEVEAKAKAHSFRIYPEEPINGVNDFDIYRVIPKIVHAVEDPKNKDIKVYVLSSGPRYSIVDDEIDPLTAMIDKLCHEQDVLFSIAAGNDGDLVPPYDRIQPPADTVNGLSVGAYSYDDNGGYVETTYSCNGPGRVGSQIKPDILGFGGCEKYPFYVRVASPPHRIGLKGICGTSFAAPLIGQKAALLLHGVDDEAILRPQTAKALLIHDAVMNGPHCVSDSWGISSENPEDILSCYGYESTLIFNGDIPFATGVALPIPFPEENNFKGRIDISWTIVYSSMIVPSSPDEYTLAGTEVYFVPHKYNYQFVKKDGKKINRQVVDIRDKGLVETLQNGGWQCNNNNITKSFRKEMELRKEGKWDTVFRGSTTKLASGLVDPYIHIHALARGNWGQNRGPERLSYAAVITARMVSQKENLYQQVRLRWPQLVPVRIRGRVMI